MAAVGFLKLESRCHTTESHTFVFITLVAAVGFDYLNKNTVATSESRTLSFPLYTGGKRWDIGLIHASMWYLENNSLFGFTSFWNQTLPTMIKMLLVLVLLNVCCATMECPSLSTIGVNIFSQWIKLCESTTDHVTNAGFIREEQQAFGKCASVEKG